MIFIAVNLFHSHISLFSTSVMIRKDRDVLQVILRFNIVALQGHSWMEWGGGH